MDLQLKHLMLFRHFPLIPMLQDFAAIQWELKDIIITRHRRFLEEKKAENGRKTNKGWMKKKTKRLLFCRPYFVENIILYRHLVEERCNFCVFTGTDWDWMARWYVYMDCMHLLLCTCYIYVCLYDCMYCEHCIYLYCMNVWAMCTICIYYMHLLLYACTAYSMCSYVQWRF